MTTEDQQLMQECLRRLGALATEHLFAFPRNIIASALMAIGIEQAIFGGKDIEDIVSVVRRQFAAISETIEGGALLAAMPTGTTQ